jgi:excinuclease ABC subunit B
MSKFILESEFSPKGDQGAAIAALTEGVNSEKKHQVLLGVTGSGKTFTMANVQQPMSMVVCHKTPAEQRRIS